MTAAQNGRTRSMRIGIDIGGTFTDLVGVAADGQLFEAKVPSRREEPEKALTDGLSELANLAGLRTIEALLSETEMVVQGTTIAINAVLQRKGVRTALLCTSGFRDTLEIRLGYKEDRYNFAYRPPDPLVPRRLRFPITERVDKLGSPVISLDESDVIEAARVCRDAQVEAVAICFLWSFLHAEHELRAEEILREQLPGVFVTRSTAVLPVMREYNRTSTTVLNAYVGPIVARYVQRTEQSLRAMGFTGRIRYVQSNGGLAEASEVLRRPVLLLVSGPAAAPAAGLHFAQVAGRNFITMDMGGTSFDVCLVRDGLPDIRGYTEVDGYRTATPLIDVTTIGAGGGSIATIDEGLLRVGPESAEAYPGPAAYMRGGSRPTVTDANVAIGVLNQSALLGGRFPISSDLASSALTSGIGAIVNLDVKAAAAGVIEVVNRNMADAMREITIRRGHDPRDYSLVVGGGAGASHAAHLAAELGIRKVLIPRIASAFCAFGAIVADVRHDYTVSYVAEMTDVDMRHMRTTFEGFEKLGTETLADEGIPADAMRFLRFMDLRYKHQVFEVPIAVSDLNLADDSQQLRSIIEDRFHREHQRLYQFSQPGYQVELITLSLIALGRARPVQFQAMDSTSPTTPQPRDYRSVQFQRNEIVDRVPVYDGMDFVGDTEISGPAIIEEPHTTISIPSGWHAEFIGNQQVYVLERPSTPGELN